MVVNNCPSNASSRRKKSKHLPPSTKPWKAGPSFRRTRITPTRFSGRLGSSPSSAAGPATPRIGHPDQSPSTTEWLASKSSSLAEPSKMCRNTSADAGSAGVLMNSFHEHHKDSIRWQYRCFDRILLNGLIQPFQQPERVVGFFNTYRQLYPVSR